MQPASVVCAAHGVTAAAECRQKPGKEAFLTNKTSYRLDAVAIRTAAPWMQARAAHPNRVLRKAALLERRTNLPSARSNSALSVGQPSSSAPSLSRGFVPSQNLTGVKKIEGTRRLGAPDDASPKFFRRPARRWPRTVPKPSPCVAPSVFPEQEMPVCRKEPLWLPCGDPRIPLLLRLIP